MSCRGQVDKGGGTVEEQAGLLHEMAQSRLQGVHQGHTELGLTHLELCFAFLSLCRVGELLLRRHETGFEALAHQGFRGDPAGAFPSVPHLGDDPLLEEAVSDRVVDEKKVQPPENEHLGGSCAPGVSAQRVPWPRPIVRPVRRICPPREMPPQSAGIPPRRFPGPPPCPPRHRPGSCRPPRTGLPTGGTGSPAPCDRLPTPTADFPGSGRGCRKRGGTF